MTTALVVAIEPDREQAARLSAIVQTRLGAELVLADSVARALTALGERVPDLILTPALMSTRDEGALSARLRELGAAAAHVQTVTAPRIGGARAGAEEGGIFRRFRRSRPAPAATDGCEPDVFAQQVSEYLQRARAERPAVVAPPIEAVVTGEVIAPPAVVEPAAAPALMEAVEPMPVFEPVLAVADLPVIAPVVAAVDLPVIEQVTVRTAIEELTAPAPVEAEAIAAPVVIALEEFAVAALIVEEIPVQTPVEIEQLAAAPVMLEELIAPTPLTIEEPVAPPLIEVEEAVALPAIAAEILAPLAAGPLEDDQFHIAAQDSGDIDMSTLLDGIVLPDAAATDTAAPQTEAAAPGPEPLREPEPEPEEDPEPVLAPLPARRMLPPRRPLPAHDRAAEAKAARRRVKPPVQDEWGLFDPEQCGFAALLAKLDAVTEDEELSKRRGTQARVISYN